MSIYPLWFRVIRSLVRPFFKKFEVYDRENIKSPCVIITRHLNNFGPAAAFLYTPAEFHLWTYHAFLEPDTFYKQCVEYTFTKRAGMSEGLAKFVAWILKYPASFAFRQVRLIPVYRGMKAIFKTMELSLDVLEKNENVMIFPDVNYFENSREMTEMYTGFIYLGKLYYKRTGKRLRFVPMSINRDKRYLRVGPEIEYDPTQPAQMERDRIAAYLREELKDCH